MDNPKRILIAPLNWGLGHATRCIPIIEALQAAGAEVLLASDGRALHLLAKEFPELPAFELPAYQIRYPGRQMMWQLFWQLPKIARAIYLEHLAIRKLIQREKIDLVISDNRFGCFSASTYNVFLTHQLHIKVPSALGRSLVSWINHRMIGRFDECWIPDQEKEPNLSGDLSHPATLPNCHYLGLLSRMRAEQSLQRYDLTIVLSGPEPQRSYLEQKICGQLERLEGLKKVLLVQGITSRQERKVEGMLETVSYLTSRDLNEALLASQLILCRSGYSSLMDLAYLGKQALLIPTPGQTEQEYLAQHLLEQGLFYTVDQDGLDLPSAIVQAQKYPGFGAGALSATTSASSEERLLEKRLKRVLQM